MPTTTERFWTIPNILSLYRILMFPVLLGCLWQGERRWFTGLLALSLLTDILDGWIARTFNQRTAVGARLDSWADLGSYILAYAAVVQFEWPWVLEHKIGLILFGSLYLACMLFVTFKFGGIIGLHLYSAKITGYLQGGFLLVLLWSGNVEWLYYLMIGVGCLSELEQIAVLAILKAPKSDVKGLYWVVNDIMMKDE